METGANASLAAENDSRTFSITPKRPLNDADEPSVSGKRLKRAKSEDSSDSSHESSSLDNHSDSDGGGSDHSGAEAEEEEEEEEEDDEDMSISSGCEEYDVDIIEPGRQNATSQPDHRPAQASQNSPDGTTARNENDLDLPLADILQRLPTKQDFLKATEKRNPENFFLRQQKRLPLRTNVDYVKRLTQAFHKYHEAMNRVSRVQKKGKTNIELEKSAVRDAKVALAWCVYFPVHCVWHNPPSGKYLGSKKRKDRALQEATRRDFLHRVGVCLDEGTLLDLRHGKLGGPAKFEAAESEIPKMQESQQVKKLLSKKKAQLKKLQKKPATDQKGMITDLEQTIRNLVIDQKYSAFFPSNRSYVLLSTFKKLGENAGHEAPDKNGTAVQTWNYVRVSSPRELIRFKEGEDLQNGHDSMSALADDVDMRDSSSEASSDGGLMINVRPERNHSGLPSSTSLLNLSPETEAVDIPGKMYTGGETSESGEISSGSDDTGINVPTKRSDPPNARILPESQFDGAPEMEETQVAVKTASSLSHGRKILAELSPEDLNAQLKYFHAHSRPDQVSMECAVRCLCCGDVGHVAGECEQLVCSKCDAYNMHLDSECDIIRTCTKCRETGHGAPSCPYKLKAPASVDDPCRLCSFSGHLEEDCELLWRTSGAPWKSDIDRSHVRLGCYECGKKGHLGNDCPTRQPGKPFGTSTWSLKREPPPTQLARGRKARPVQRQDGLSIKGHADKRMRLPPKPPSKNSSQRTFDQPERLPPKPARRGQIQINPGIAQSATVDSFRPAWSPVSEPVSQPHPVTGDNRPRLAGNVLRLPDRQEDRHYRPSPKEFKMSANLGSRNLSDTWPRPALPPANQYPDYEADMRYEYHAQHPNAMDRPPTHEQQQAFLGSYPTQPPSYQEQPPQRQQTYQPMPSSGKKAWAQFRS